MRVGLLAVVSVAALVFVGCDGDDAEQPLVQSEQYCSVTGTLGQQTLNVQDTDGYGRTWQVDSYFAGGSADAAALEWTVPLTDGAEGSTLLSLHLVRPQDGERLISGGRTGFASSDAAALEADGCALRVYDGAGVLRGVYVPDASAPVALRVDHFVQLTAGRQTKGGAAATTVTTYGYGLNGHVSGTFHNVSASDDVLSLDMAFRLLSPVW